MTFDKKMIQSIHYEKKYSQFFKFCHLQLLYAFNVNSTLVYD